MYHWLGFIREDWEEKSALSLKWNLGVVNVGNGEIQTAPTRPAAHSLASFPVVILGRSPFFDGII